MWRVAGFSSNQTQKENKGYQAKEINMKKYWKQVTLPLMAGAAVLLLAACGNSGQTSQSASSSQSQAAVSSSAGTVSASSSSSASAVSEAASSSAAGETSDLDGTYKASNNEGEELTLVLSGQGGTLTTREADGEQELEQVQLDPTNQTMVIGDDLMRYRIDGGQLTLEDLDQELHEREILVFTKQ